MEAAVEAEGWVAGDDDVDEGAGALFSYHGAEAKLDGWFFRVGDVDSASVTGPDGVFGEAHVGVGDDGCLKGGFPGEGCDQKEEEWF